ncbi:amidohydrolase [Egibacter rhizosphaerae]|uniref:Amidohydrolase n=1 Tax=Egibacter rhizosphaerae TaxID=1670831 RepID=A0A411YIA1_9ACTN|nr:amidohydrolase family protein [Egibacter rhizosphaerae]QBI20816.1 amidohydrolase [Egibacter rhizosphaerae]
MLKIDAFNHVLPPRYFEKMNEVNPGLKDIGKRVRNVRVLVDMDQRLRMIEQFGDDYRQVLSVAAPPIERVAGPEASPELAEVANDEMARLVSEHDRFVGFIASMPMNNPDAAVTEAKRAIDQLGATGIQMFTNVNGSPLDRDELLDLFQLLHDHDLPIWVHPARGAEMPDYVDEDGSKYEIWWTFGWPYETSAMMARLIFSGHLDRFPNLKVITHHLGGMTPYFEGRVGPGMDQLGSRTTDEDYTSILERLDDRPIEYFRRFYGDTAVFGSDAATRCGLEFFGADHVLFASDCPFDPEKGPGFIRETIRVLDEADYLDEATRAQIYEGNAKRLMRLHL